MRRVSARWNRRLYAVHQWLGLLGGALLLMLSLTGAALVFEEEIDDRLAQEYFTVPVRSERVSIDSLFAAAEAHLPGGTGLFLRSTATAPGRTAEFGVTKPDGKYWFVYVDPHTGRVVGDRDANGSFVRILLVLHYALLWRPIGELVICIMGMALIASTFTGAWIYRKSLLAPFRTGVRFRAGSRRLASDVHHLLGVAALAFNLVIGVTGTIMLWGSWETVAAHLRGAKRDPSPEPVRLASVISLDDAVQLAKQALPTLTMRQVIPPTTTDSIIGVYGRAAGAPMLTADFAQVEIHARTGQVTAVRDPAMFNWREVLEVVIYPLHFGNFGGLPVKILYALLALTPGVLSVSGFMLWWARRRSARRAGTTATRATDLQKSEQEELVGSSSGVA